MKQIIVSMFCIFVVFGVSACSNSKITNTSPTSVFTPQFVVSKKTSLEIIRNGKTYEILIGHSMGGAAFYATPMGEIPKSWSENYADGAQIETYSDFDHDSEIEILVSAFVCGGNCSNRLMVYEYDPAKDTYFVSDQIWARVRDYTDFNKDGTFEFTLYENGFCFRCSNASDALSTLIILHYEKGKFVDVSTEFPKLIQKDADSFLKSAKSNEQDSADIFLPGYLFNMYRLDKIVEGRPIFDQVCLSVIKPNRSNSGFEFDCTKFRADVEKSIMEYKFQP